MTQIDKKTYFDLDQDITKTSIHIRCLGCYDSPQWKE